MAPVAPQPDSPSAWQEYANTSPVSTLPLRAADRAETKAIYKRDVYLDASKALEMSTDRLYIFTDVLAFTDPETTISAPPYGVLMIMSRVLTASTPVNIKMNVDSGSGCVVWIYGSILDRPLTLSVGSSDPIALDLGPQTSNMGILLSVLPDGITPIYQTVYLEDINSDFQALLETQLRITQCLFWSKTSLAISLCSFVAKATANPALYPHLNAQAIALGQQLAAQEMTGPDMRYAPVLKLDSYRVTVNDALNAVAAFEDQYNRFKDNTDNIEIQKKAWDTMLQQAVNNKTMREYLRKSAYEKYQDACKVVARCHTQLEGDVADLESAKQAFKAGLDAWESKQRLAAVFGILGGIIKFAVGVGTICFGDPAGIGTAAEAIDAAVSGVKEAEKIPDQTGVKLSSKTLNELGECMKALEKVYPLVDGAVKAVKKLETNPDADIPAIGEISGSSYCDADASIIVALGSWDKWTLESDQQLDFAIAQNIAGASAYRTALRKHAVNGKGLAQAQAEAVKAGQEYIQAAMEVVKCAEDIKSLKELLNGYKGQAEIYAQAEAKFFDRFLALRTGLVMELRNMVWAYRYWALADSQVVLDSQKTTPDYRSDLYYIDRDIQTANERYATDFQPFQWSVSSLYLHLDYPQSIIAGLQGKSHTASFTLIPETDPAGSAATASVFIDGSHFRLDGLETVLQGVVPRPEALKNGVTQVDIQISTSGVYSDTQDGKVFHFTSLPRSVRFSYDIDANGVQGDTHIHAIFPTEDHAEPTPFAQWTIKLLHPERLDLSGLTGVMLQWKGHARYSESSRRKLKLRV